jgi:CRISPR-associated protein Csd1
MMPAVLRTSGIRPAFLWDKTAYVFGVTAVEEETETGKRLAPGQGRRTLEEHEAFRRAHLDGLAQSRDAGLVALRLFVERWRPEQWNALAFTNDALDENIAFRLLGNSQRIDERDAARELVQRRANSNTETAHCLVTGRLGPYAVLQPQFKGVQGAQSSGAPLVSFNADAFESYGKKDGANAPVSEDAAFRYGAALNWLLDRSHSRSFRLGETTVVFWADEKEVGEASASAAEDDFWEGFGTSPERDADAADADTIRTGLTNVQNLRAAPDISKLKPETRLHVLGLSPNSGRIAVRFWLVDTYGHLAENLVRHKNDVAIVPPGRHPHQKAYALLYETAVQRKAENIPPRLGGELARAILTGGQYPRTLLTSVLGRMRADKTMNATRAGICKAVINRDDDREVIPVALDPESNDQAYNLGRLFAVYEYAERQVAERNATIRDKYIGAASATPRRVFPSSCADTSTMPRPLPRARATSAGPASRRRRPSRRSWSASGERCPFLWPSLWRSRGASSWATTTRTQRSTPSPPRPPTAKHSRELPSDRPHQPLRLRLLLRCLQRQSERRSGRGQPAAHGPRDRAGPRLGRVDQAQDPQLRRRCAQWPQGTCDLRHRERHSQ